MADVTLDNPTVDGWIAKDEATSIYSRVTNTTDIRFYRLQYGPPPKFYVYRGYIEWDISSIPSGSTITKVELRYQGETNPVTDNCYIYAMANQPSIQADNSAGNQIIWDDCGNGTAYLSNDSVFPEVAVNKDVGGATGPAWDTDPCSDVEAAIDSGWFALGFKTSEITVNDKASFKAEEAIPTPAPTLYIEYTPPAVGTNMKVNISDVFKDVSEIKINIGGTWKAVTKIQINIGDEWKTVFG